MRKTLRSCAVGKARRPHPERAAGSVGAEVPPTAARLEAELVELERLSLDDLRLRWRNKWGRLAPAHLSRGVLFRIMAYRLQAAVFGDLDRKTIQTLDRLADYAANRPASNCSAALGADERAELGSSARAAYEPLVLKPGAFLIREWQDRLERVTVVGDGFAWNGATYASLSAVAFAITGTKWNGHRFFGVPRRESVRTSERKVGADRRARPSASPPREPINRPHPAADGSRPWASTTTDVGESDP